MILTLRLALALSSLFTVYATLDLCGKCKKDECMPPLACKKGLTNDSCNCCLVCRSEEGELCGGINSQFGICDEGLNCIKREPKSIQNMYLPMGSKVGRCEPAMCETVKCGMHQTCTVVNGTAECVCPMNCGNKLEPVCGLSDGKDYRNPCQVRERECKLQVLIGYSQGYCKGCVKNGREYKFGEKATGMKKCEECTCRHGNWACALNLKCLRDVVYQGFECTGYSNQHPPIECPDGYRCNITEKGQDGFAERGICKRLVPADVCMLLADSGPCYGYFVRWHFDAEEGECKRFVYGGCRGNDNRFKSKQGCEKICKKGLVPDPYVLGDQDSGVDAPKQKRHRRVKVSGKMNLGRKVGKLPSGSCLAISVEDVSRMDVPSITMASQKRNLSNADLSAKPLYYSINFLPNDAPARYDVQATINVGWCPGKTSKDWIHEKDYLTTTSFTIPLNNKDDAYSLDIELEYNEPASTTARSEAPTIALREIPEPLEEFPSDSVDQPEPVEYSNETVTIFGQIELEADVAKLPSPSCMVISVQDVSLMDASSLLLAYVRKDVSGLEITNNTIEYKVMMKKPLEKEFYRSFAVEASISVGWCSYKEKRKSNVNYGDFITDTTFNVVFDNETNTVEKNFHLIYYCPGENCEFSRTKKARDEGTVAASAIKEQTCYSEEESRAYPLGAEWETSDCLSCRCLENGTSCQTKPCPKLSCQLTKHVEGECCPVCAEKPKFCLDSRGGKRRFGETWKGLDDDCERCTCLPNGKLMCAMAGCLDPVCHKGKPIKVSGLCCRVCSDKKICKEPEDGEVYVEGRIWQRKNCSLAYCSSSGLIDVPESDIVVKCPYPAKMVEGCPTTCTRRTVDKLEARLRKITEEEEEKEEKQKEEKQDEEKKEKEEKKDKEEEEKKEKEEKEEKKEEEEKKEKKGVKEEEKEKKEEEETKKEEKEKKEEEETKEEKKEEEETKEEKKEEEETKEEEKEKKEEEETKEEEKGKKEEEETKEEEKEKKEEEETKEEETKEEETEKKEKKEKEEDKEEVKNEEEKKENEEKEEKLTLGSTCIDNKTKERYSVGQHWHPEPCQVCVCRGDLEIRCKAIKCKPQKNCSQLVKPAGKCCPICKSADKFCVHKEIKHKPGDFFVGDDKCSLCICNNGKTDCSQEFCKKGEGCVYDGEKYKEGERVKQDCNTCVCGKTGAWACTLKLCLGPTLPGGLKPTSPKDETTEAPGCIYNGETYEVGESTKQDCNTCICGKMGMWGCTKKLCLQPSTKELAETAKPSGCIYEGKSYAEGETRDAGDGCNTCFCAKNGGWGCTLKFCVDPPTTQQPNSAPKLQTSATTAPPEQGCTYEGKSYDEGETRDAGDGCNTCFCAKDGGWGCTLKFCVGSPTTQQPNSTPKLQTTAATAPPRPGCIHDGKVFKPGTSRLADDGCNTCVCMGITWSCTEMACVTTEEDGEEP